MLPHFTSELSKSCVIMLHNNCQVSLLLKITILGLLLRPVRSIKPVNATGVINANVSSVIDLRSQLVYVKTKIDVVNHAEGRISSYRFFIPEPELFSILFTDDLGDVLDYSNSTNASWRYFEVFLRGQLEPGETRTISVYLAYAEKITHVHKKRRQSEHQFVRYKGALAFLSPYVTEFYRAKYLFKDLRIFREFSVDPLREDATKAVYEFTDIAPMTQSSIEIVYVNDEPFLVIKSLKRIIYVSHFDKIFIKDRVELENDGPELLGEFNNTRYSSGPPRAATTWLHTHLPASTTNIQFYDDIGNNSRSSMMYFDDYLSLKFSPRYPLLGGWKTSYILQYAVPTHEYLFTDNKGYFSLQIRAVDHVLNDKVIKKAKVKIIFPEGTTLKEVEVPEGLVWSKNETDCVGGLCIVGRPSVILEGRDLFTLPSGGGVFPVTISYSVHYGFLLKSPMLIVFYLQIAFLFYVLYRLLVLQFKKWSAHF